MSQTQKAFTQIQQIDQTQVFFQQNHKLNQTIFYFPTFLRIKLKYVASMNVQTRFASAYSIMYLTVHYGNVGEEIVNQLSDKIFVEPEFNDRIMVTLDQTKDKTEVREPIYLINDKKKKLLHWKIILKDFQLKIKPHIFFHPFETVNLNSQIKVPPIQIELKNAKTVIAVFNLMDNKQMHKKIIEGQKIHNVFGFYLSPKYMSLYIKKTKRQMKYVREIIEADKMYTLENEKSNDLEEEMTFIKENQRELRHVKDYFSTAYLDLHLHTNGKTAYSNFSSNFLCFIMLAILSIFVHFQEMKADEIAASLATIAIAFGTSIISIRSQILFKPGQTLFEIIYCSQMLVLVFPLFSYWLKLDNSSSTSSSGPSDTSFNTTVIYYLDQLLSEVRIKPLVENYWKDGSFVATIVFTALFCFLIASLFLVKVLHFFTYMKRSTSEKVKVENDFIRFNHHDWNNEQCREFFNNSDYNSTIENLGRRRISVQGNWIGGPQEGDNN